MISYSDSMLESFARRYGALLTLTIELSYSCDQQCIHCAVNYKDKTCNTYDVISRAILEAKECGCLDVILTGGEPTIQRSYFIKLVRFIREHKLSLRIFTNGQIVDQELLDLYCELGVFDFEISIFSLDHEIHDQIVGKKGALARLLLNLDKLRERDRRVYLKCPLMNVNFAGYEKLEHYAVKNGFKISFSPRITSKSDGDEAPQKFRLSDQELESYFLKKESFKSGNENQNEFEYTGHQCEDCLTQATISPNGDVRTCSQLDIVLGNVNIDSLSNLWRVSKGKKEVITLDNSKLIDCIHCNLINYCKRCPGLANLEDGNINGCSTVAQKEAIVKKRIYFLLNRESNNVK